MTFPKKAIQLSVRNNSASYARPPGARLTSNPAGMLPFILMARPRTSAKTTTVEKTPPSNSIASKKRDSRLDADG
jgi:hypothetical protein